MNSLGYEYQSDFARRYFGEGKAEGLIEGRMEGRVELILELLARRFCIDTHHTIARAPCPVRVEYQSPPSLQPAAQHLANLGVVSNAGARKSDRLQLSAFRHRAD
jgi:hypothetical protein